MGKNYHRREILLFYLLVLFITAPSTAQKDYRRGYILTNDSDTIRGLLNYKTGRLYEFAKFRRNPDDPPRNLGAEDIKGFGFDGDKVFISREIYLAEKGFKRLFLEILVQGEVSLFKHKRSFYAARQNDSLYHLTNESRETYIQGQQYVAKSNQHIAILNMLLYDCVTLRPKIRTARPTEINLTRLIEAYNQCMGYPVTSFKDKKPWMTFKIGVLAGWNMTNINFKPKWPSSDYLLDASRMDHSPVVGLAINAGFPRLNEKLYFDGAFTYNKLALSSDSEFSNEFLSTRHNFTMEAEQWRITTGIKYLFPERKVTPYLSAGLSHIINFNRHVLTIQRNDINDTVETFSISPFDIARYQYSFYGAVGVHKPLLPKFDTFFQLRFEKTKDITESPDINSDIWNLQILLGVFF